jgi:hypothetical protein
MLPELQLWLLVAVVEYCVHPHTKWSSVKEPTFPFFVYCVGVVLDNSLMLGSFMLGNFEQRLAWPIYTHCK